MDKVTPKSFWWYIRHKLKTKTGVAPLLGDNEDPWSTKFEDKANIIQRQFSSVFTREPDTDIPKLDKKTDESISTLFVTDQMVRDEILKLNVNKSCGPDNVHPRLLIELVDYLYKPTSLLLNRTMEEGEQSRKLQANQPYIDYM